MNIRHWLDNIPFSDPLERRQAGLLQVMLLIAIGGCVIGLSISLASGGSGGVLSLGLLIYTSVFLCIGSALLLLRRGHFKPAVSLSVLGSILPISLALIAIGLNQAQGPLMALTIPTTLAGLLLGRRGLLLAGGSCIAIVITVGLVEQFMPGLVGFRVNPNRTVISIAAVFVMLIVVLSLFLDRFGDSLRDALTAALTRERELERLRESLEHIVAERTASLQQALQDVEQREVWLTRTLEDLRTSQVTIRELSAPVIPVLPGVLVAPLIGALDSERITTLAENILGSVERLHARYVIFDITGVPIVDTQVAQALLQAAASARLLGAQVLLVGIRPEVAQTIVTLGVDLKAITTYPDLQEAVEALLPARNSQPYAGDAGADLIGNSSKQRGGDPKNKLSTRV